MKFKSYFITSILVVILLSSITVNADPVVTTFGETGTGDGQFDTPRGVLIVDDIVYVSDFSNDRIQMFDLAGNYQGQFGTSGSAAGQLLGPEGMAYQDSKLYVAEYGNGRVQVFDLDGNHLDTFGESEMTTPFDVAVTDGRIFVADRNGGGLFTYNINDYTYLGGYGEFFASTTYRNPDGPTGVDINGDFVYMADYFNDTIKIYESLGSDLHSYFGDEPATDQSLAGLENPWGVKVVDDVIIVSDFSGLKFFDQQGNLLDGYFPGVSFSPKFFDLNDHHLIVADDEGNEVHILQLVGNVTDIAVSAGQTGITVTWDIDNSAGLFDAEAYKVYRDGNFLVETSEKFFTDNTALPGESYQYSIQAIGSVGQSPMADAASTITVEGLVTVTEQEQETITESAFDFVPINIFPVLTILLLIPLIRKKFR